MDNFIGTKIVKAEPMNENVFLERFRKSGSYNYNNRDGYHVVYPNENGEYHSWSPKDVFEQCYRVISKSESDFLSYCDKDKN